MPATVAQLCRFPVKGLSPERLDHIGLRAGQGVPGDRMFGFARHGSGFDPSRPRPLPKDRFVVLLTQADLASLDTAFAADTGMLTIRAPEGQVAFDMNSPAGAAQAGIWLHDYLSLPDPEPPRFVSAAPHRFTDVSVVSAQLMNAISVLNLASVRALQERLGTAIDPARFRANIQIDGLPPWWELENIGGTITVGEVVLRPILRTKRCAATEVNPKTSQRDLRLPYLLRREMGHMDMGCYVEVVRGGTLRPGMPVTVRR